MREHEITGPVDLCLPDGRLNTSGVGWSRTPLHNTRLPHGLGAWGRNKQWEYWGIITPEYVIGFTISDLDYAAVHQLWILDRATGEVIDEAATVPFARDTTMPASLGQGPSRGNGPGLALAIDELPDDASATVPHGRRTRLRARTERAHLDLVATRPVGSEAMCVVVPWTPTRFQYTVKDLAIPVRGSLTIDGRTHKLPSTGAWAVLDHGRGRWPYEMTWNWGAGSGIVDGQRIGLQLGGKWTDRTGSTENAVIVDGRTHKISEDLVWEYDRQNWLTPWRVHGDRVDVRFIPFHLRTAVTDLLVLSGHTHQGFGHWEGWVLDDHGHRVMVDGVVGWAEEAHNRW